MSGLIAVYFCQYCHQRHRHYRRRKVYGASVTKRPKMHYNVSASKQGWLGIYRRYILLIYIGYFRLKISDIFDFYRVFFYFLI